jgi:hypothetical protein
MASKFNSEFNYRYQVIGETVWEKIKTLKGFLEGRKRAAALEEVSKLRRSAKEAELKHLEETNAPLHLILNLRADIMEWNSGVSTEIEAFELNREEIHILEKMLAEFYAIAEPSRILGYTDEQMFELNAANEFTTMIARDIHSEVLCHGAPSPAKLRNAMSNPYTWQALQSIGLVPEGTPLLHGNVDPALPIELSTKPTIGLPQSQVQHKALET